LRLLDSRRTRLRDRLAAAAQAPVVRRGPGCQHDVDAGDAWRLGGQERVLGQGEGPPCPLPAPLVTPPSRSSSAVATATLYGASLVACRCSLSAPSPSRCCSWLSHPTA